MKIACTLLLALACLVALVQPLAVAVQPPAAQPRSAELTPTGDIQPNSAIAAPEWTALFDRSSGWTGADGVYTAPLIGDERNGAANVTSTLWVFSDTYIGGVDANGVRTGGTVMINNSMARLYGSQPDPGRLAFYWGASGSGDPASRVLPQDGSGVWFWPVDVIALHDQLRMFALRVRSDATAGFAVVGIDLLTSSLRAGEPFGSYTQQTTPLYTPASGSYGDAYYGIGIMANTLEAGAPQPDGYVYIYGVRNDALNKKLLVARVRPANIASFADYRYWDGKTWQPDITRARALYDRVSSELSVTPLSDGRYLLVFHMDTIGSQVAVSYGASPVGPWGPPIPIWTCPEDTLTRNTFTYGSKAHPHLSSPGELLISYHVNTDNARENWNNADIYRPRFIKVKLNQNAAVWQPTPAQSAPGDLDPTFGIGGRVVTPLGKADEYAAAAARQADGKIVVAGRVSAGDIVLARYLPNGQLDGDFGSSGVVTTDFAGLPARATAITVQPDGKILIGGTGTVAGQTDFAVARYLPDGTLDFAFDGDGRQAIDFAGLSDEAHALLLQPDGKILVAGSADVGGGQRDLALLRLNLDGSRDSGFGADGKVTTDFGGVGNAAYALALLADGSIVAAGANFTGYQPADDMLVARYTPGGALDSTFAMDGAATVDFAGAGDAARAAAVQADGKIVVAGHAYTGSNDDDFALARLNPDGSLDLAFSGDGKLITDFAGAYDLAQAIAVLPNGKLLAAGRSQGLSQDFAVARYNPDGLLDAAFDGDGRLTTDFGSAQDEAAALVLLPDARFLLAGSAGLATDDFALACYESNGSLDASFGIDGNVAVDFGLGDSVAHGVVVQGDGKLIAAGDMRTGRESGTAFTAARLTPTGGLDASFGTGGVAAIDFGAPGQARAVALEPDGKVLLAGTSGLGPTGQFALARLNGNGTLDVSFASGGKLTTSFAGGPSIANAVLVQPDGKIVAAGIVGLGPSDVAIARYSPDGILDTSFSGDGLTTVDINGGADAAWSLAVQSDGRIVAAGYAYSNATSDFALVRLTPDGALDTSFDGDGKLLTDFGGVNSFASGVSVLPDGRIVVAGEVETNGGDFGLARYHPNGSLDASFDADGKATAAFASHDAPAALLVQYDGKLLLAGRSQVADGRDDFALVRFSADGSPDTSFNDEGRATADFTGTDASALAAALQPDGHILLAGDAGNLALARFLGRPTLAITITADGQDVILSWAMTSAATSCEIWRSTLPYFAPGDPVATLASTITPCVAGVNTWRDPMRAGDPAENYTYRVRTFGAADGDATSNANGEFDYELVR